MRRAQAGVLLGSAIVALPAAALAQPPSLPTGGAYVAGAGSIATAGPAMTITQSSKRAVLDWQGFSIGAGDQVRFNNGSGATLNRVTGASLSTIAGALSASGSVYLINPNGVVIGPGGKIVTGGSFVAATRDVANSQFMAGGSLTVSGSSNGTGHRQARRFRRCRRGRRILRMRILSRAILAGVLLLAPSGLATAQNAAPQNALPGRSAAAATAPTTIDGFRSARFGMTEADVRKAIAADFRLSGPAVRSGENPIQRTRFLNVTMPDLVPGSGRAMIDYVFGYRSGRLIEVNITWSAAIDPANTPPMLVRTGGILQSYFAARSFAPGKALANVVLPNGSLLLFRGTDPQGHIVALILAGPLRKDAKDHSLRMTAAILSLAYAEDPAHPDVFRLRKGEF
jgi:filamentous hemagglutinin family protein